MSILNNIEGVFTLTSPLHCSAGSESSTTKTAKQPMVSAHGTTYIPYFPANDVRGRLRRKAAKILIDHLTISSGKISIELLAGLTCGAISANGENDISVEEVLRARENIYMGLFGGGTRLMRSGFKVHDLMPFIEETITAGVVPSHLGVEVPMDSKGGGKDASGNNIPAPLKAWKLVHNHQTVRVDDTYRVLNLTLLEQALEDPKEEVSEYQLAVIAGRSKRNADKVLNKKTTLENIMEAETIAIGTQLHFRVDLEDHLSDAQKGLALLAIRDLCNEQALGGMVRHGWGKFKAELRGSFNGNNLNEEGTPNPVLALNEMTGLYELSGIAQVYAESALEEISKLTVSDMWLFFKANKVEKEDKATVEA